jgi:hypothetical protein
MAAVYALAFGLTLLLVAWIVWRIWLRRRLQPRAECAAVLGRAGTDRDAQPAPSAVARIKGKTLTRRRLSITDREHYLLLWKANQARFAIDLRGAVLEAEAILTEMLRRRGYPLSQVHTWAGESLPAQHRIVGNYLVATEIVGRYRRGELAVDDLGKAMVCYRALFAQLLDGQATSAEESFSRRMARP